MARRTRRYRHGRGRRGVSQWCRPARTTPIPGGAERLPVRAQVGVRAEGRPRNLQAGRLRRIRRRQSLAGDGVERQAERTDPPDRWRVRPVPVHLERLRAPFAGARVVNRERRLRSRRRCDGRAGASVRPDRRKRDQSARVAASRRCCRPERPAAPRYLGERTRSAARRRPHLLPQTAGCGRQRRFPNGQRHGARRRRDVRSGAARRQAGDHSRYRGFADSL